MSNTPPRTWTFKGRSSSLKAVSKYLVVRPLRLSDYKAWRLGVEGRLPSQSQFDEPDIAEAELTRTKYRELVRSKKLKADAGRIYSFGIFDRRSGAHLGTTSLFMMCPQLSWANLGYSIHNQFWGYGFAREAAMLTLEIAFRKLKIYRVEASCEKSNHASRKVALAAGLVEEGERRKFFPHNGGVDMYVFAQNAYDFNSQT